MKAALEKHINILDYSLSSLWRRKLKNISVLLVFTLVIFLLASFQMVTEALTKLAGDSLQSAPEITIQKIVAGRQESIPMSYESQLSEIFGIQKIVPRIWGYYFDEANLANYTIMGLDISAMPHGKQLNLALAEGRMPFAGGRGEAVIGRSIHKVMDLKDRRVISFFKPDLSLKSFAVSGIFSGVSDLLTSDLIVMNLGDARELFAIPEGLVTDLCVYVANPLEIETIAKKISEQLPDTRIVTRPQIMKTYKVVFGWRSGFASVCLLTALAAFIILAWDKASGLSPEERREIGIMKILGWETADVLAVRFWESFLVSAFAYILGMTLAYIHVAFYDASLFRPVLVGWSVLFPTFNLIPDLSFDSLLLIFSFSVLPYMAATVIPAWRCAIVPADSAIR